MHTTATSEYRYASRLLGCDGIIHCHHLTKVYRNIDKRKLKKINNKRDYGKIRSYNKNTNTLYIRHDFKRLFYPESYPNEIWFYVGGKECWEIELIEPDTELTSRELRETYGQTSGRFRNRTKNKLKA